MGVGDGVELRIIDHPWESPALLVIDGERVRSWGEPTVARVGPHSAGLTLRRGVAALFRRGRLLGAGSIPALTSAPGGHLVVQAPRQGIGERHRLTRIELVARWDEAVALRPPPPRRATAAGALRPADGARPVFWVDPQPDQPLPQEITPCRVDAPGALAALRERGAVLAARRRWVGSRHGPRGVGLRDLPAVYELRARVRFAPERERQAGVAILGGGDRFVLAKRRLLPGPIGRTGFNPAHDAAVCLIAQPDPRGVPHPIAARPWPRGESVCLALLRIGDYVYPRAGPDWDRLEDMLPEPLYLPLEIGEHALLFARDHHEDGSPPRLARFTEVELLVPR